MKRRNVNMNELLTSLLENPEALKVLIKEQVGQYKPLVYMIGTELLEVYKDFANNTMRNIVAKL